MLSRPVTRRSISRELFETDRDRPGLTSAAASSARPVARRSVSRELFDVQVKAKIIHPMLVEY